MPEPGTSARETLLRTYRTKRDFARTPEPGPVPQQQRDTDCIFVVQKHHASRLHWDFRLEYGGVLWSWAVPRGPSLDPGDKRLAVHVEDHPVEYAGFAGTIPEGNYGAGTVEIWDNGTWEPIGDAREGMARGELKFLLHGQRLRGHFVLVRLKPRPKERAENWLLIKEHDAFERPGADAAALEAIALVDVPQPGNRIWTAAGEAIADTSEPVAADGTQGHSGRATPRHAPRDAGQGSAQEQRRQSAGEATRQPGRDPEQETGEPGGVTGREAGPATARKAAPARARKAGGNTGRGNTGRGNTGRDAGENAEPTDPSEERRPSRPGRAAQSRVVVARPPARREAVGRGSRTASAEPGTSAAATAGVARPSEPQEIAAAQQPAAAAGAAPNVPQGQIRGPSGGKRKRAPAAAPTVTGDSAHDGDRAAPRPTRPAGDKANPLRSADGAPAPVQGATTTPEPDWQPPEGAVRAALPQTQQPQLASNADIAPLGAEWISEVKFDGYRLLVWKDGPAVRLVTRNGLDWTHRLPHVAAAVAALPVPTALLDGELVALQADGISSFPALQAALADGRDDRLFLYLFDLLYRDGWDLRDCPLAERKAALAELGLGSGMLRYSDHLEGDATRVRRQACSMGLEGIICKRADAPYQPGRGRGWLKVKCQGREEFVVVGWTPPQGHRNGLGSLHLGFYDRPSGAPDRHLHYVGGCGSGFSERDLADLTARLAKLATDPPAHMLLSEEKPPGDIRWVRPELVVEVQYIGWSGGGRLRHAVFLGLREDKSADEVVREVPNPEVARVELGARPRRGGIVVARAPEKRAAAVGGVRLTHPERALWPGISKQDLAEYWEKIADAALPGIAHRPLALVRCPDGIDGEHFFQKHANRGMPPQLQEGEFDSAPYLTLADRDGLIACAQMAAIELHSWGASLDDPGRPDRLVFDLDPGEGVGWEAVIRAAHDLRDRLERVGYVSFCRTSGGKGLHVVAPLRPEADWSVARPWCRAFAERMEQEAPEAYVASVPKVKRRGRILVDWLRNGLGSTAVASFSPRARANATVATPLAWREVTPKLDPQAFTLRSIPGRLARLKADPWDGFATAAQSLPQDAATPAKSRRRG